MFFMNLIPNLNHGWDHIEIVHSFWGLLNTTPCTIFYFLSSSCLSTLCVHPHPLRVLLLLSTISLPSPVTLLSSIDPMPPVSLLLETSLQPSIITHTSTTRGTITNFICLAPRYEYKLDLEILNLLWDTIQYFVCSRCIPRLSLFIFYFKFILLDIYVHYMKAFCIE